MPSAEVETLVQTAPPIIKTANGHHLVHREVRSRPYRKTLNAVVMRAGTSKGLFLRLEDLPARREDWTPIILAAMGSPDPYLKQLDGMGGGVSTQSKVAVVSRSSDPAADVDYLFIQVPVDKLALDFTGNCGNISTGVGPFAVEENLFDVGSPDRHDVTVRIRNVNTGVIIHSTFTVHNGYPVEYGSTQLDGISAIGSPVKLDFKSPGGAMTGRVLPTGSPVDIVQFGGSTYRVSCVDCANPFVFVRAEELGLDGTETGQGLVHITDTLMEIRARMSIAMGLTKSLDEARSRMGTPKIAIITEPKSYKTSTGRHVDGSSIHITARPYSMGAPHPTLPMTGAICLAAACTLPGTICNLAARPRNDSSEPYVIGHGGGTIATACVVEQDPATGEPVVESGSVIRTSRRLMQGQVLYLKE